MKKIFLILVGGVLLIIAGVSFLHSPRYSLLQIRKSIEQRDSLTFYKYVAVHEVAASVVDGVIDHSFSDSEPRGWLARAAVSFVKGLVGIAKPALTEEVKKEIRAWFRGDDYSGVELLDIIAHPSDVSFSNIAWIEKYRPAARVGLVFKKNNGQMFLLKIKMRDMGSFWQVYEVENYGEFLGWIGEKSKN